MWKKKFPNELFKSAQKFFGQNAIKKYFGQNVIEKFFVPNYARFLANFLGNILNEKKYNFFPSFE